MNHVGRGEKPAPGLSAQPESQSLANSHSNTACIDGVLGDHMAMHIALVRASTRQEIHRETKRQLRQIESGQGHRNTPHMA